MMPVTFVAGNIFDAQAESVVIPVNARGVMGAGLALQAKRRWPDLAERYWVFCRSGRMKPGFVWWRKQADFFVQCAATKDHWKQPSEMAWVEQCVERILVNCLGHGLIIRSVAIPPLGCGLGGLPWPPVRDLLIGAFEMHPTEALIYGSEEGEVP